MELSEQEQQAVAGGFARGMFSDFFFQQTDIRFCRKSNQFFLGMRIVAVLPHQNWIYPRKPRWHLVCFHPQAEVLVMCTWPNGIYFPTYAGRL